MIKPPTLETAGATLSTITAPPPATRGPVPSPRRLRTALSLVLCALPLSLSLPLFTGCAGVESIGAESEDTGDAEVGVTAQALSSVNVARVTLTISGAGISPDIVQNLVKTNGQWAGNLNGIPAGLNRTFHADAYDAASTKVYEGQVTGVTISRSAGAVVLLMLQQKVAPTPFHNGVPEIASLTTSASQVAPGGAVALNVAASDPDGDALTYAWTATGGSFSSAAVANPIWTAPLADGVYTLSVSVTDGRGSQAGLTVQARVASTGEADVTTTFNTWPVVSQMTATPGQIKPGQSTALSVVAADADADPITYAWSDSCGGSFTSTTTTNPTWTAPAVAPMSGMCTLTVTPSDNHGGSTSGSLLIGINLPTVNLPPIVDGDFQSAAVVFATTQVDLSFTAHDPEGTALAYSWTATGGTLAAPTSTASSSDVLWTAPGTSGTYTITGTAVDAGGAQATKAFSVNVSGVVAQTLSAGTYHSMFINPNGTIMTWGFNNVGQLGRAGNANVPGQSSFSSSGFTRLVGGYIHTVGLKADGTVWAAGYGGDGQLGDGNLTSTATPRQVTSLSGVVELSVGGATSFVRKGDNTVWAWGAGGTGDGTSSQRKLPTLVSGFNNVVALHASSKNHSLARKSDGTVWGWGANAFGELGDGTQTTQLSPVQASALVTGAVSLCDGGEFTAALKPDGTVWTWGNNNFGQLGDGTTTPRSTPAAVSGLSGVSAIACGWAHVLVLKSNGSAWAWGWDSTGQVGDNSNVPKLSPVPVINLGSGVIEIAAGYAHNLARKSDGTVWAWGQNNLGQVGDGTTSDRWVPLSLGTP